MKRYRLRQGKLREHESVEWVAAADAEAALKKMADSYECLRRHANLETDTVDRERADSERLDWLLSHCDLTPDGAEGQSCERVLVSREEIDKARKVADAASPTPTNTED